MKLQIGGSPCTKWSIAQTKNRETEPEGIGWELFENYLIALEKFKPDFFLYENNKSMAPAIRAQITRELGVEPILINSGLVSAQNRQSVIYAYKRNVVGKGYTLRAMTGNDELDKRIEKAWKRWCKARNCDVTGEQSFNEILRMMVERKKVDGGMIVLYRYTPGGVVPFKLQCLEVDELDKTQATPRHKGNRVVGGIEYNQYRRPVGYWIRQYDIEGWQLAEPAYIEAKDVFFYKSKHRPSQLREMSDMSPTITRVRDTNEFINAVSVRERIAACLAVLIKKTLPTGGTGRSSWSNKGGQVDYAGKRLSPGMMMEMGPGDDAQIIDPKGAATDATAFLKTQQGLLCPLFLLSG